jgi:hypothetical protein
MFCVVLLVTFIMHVIYSLIIAVVVVSSLCVCLELLSGNLMHIVELVSSGDRQIMETPDNIGIKLFVLAALKEYWLYLLLFLCLCCAVPVLIDYRLCLVTVCVKALQNGRLTQIFKEDRLLVRR